MPIKKKQLKKIGSQIKKVKRKTAVIARKSAPVLQDVGKTGMVIGAASGQPELVTAGAGLVAAGKVGKIAGGSKLLKDKKRKK